MTPVLSRASLECLTFIIISTSLGSLGVKVKARAQDSSSLHPYLEVSLSQIKDQGYRHSPIPVSVISLPQSQPIPSKSKRRIQSYLESSAATAIDMMWYSLLMLRGFSVDPCLLLFLAAHHCPAQDSIQLVLGLLSSSSNPSSPTHVILVYSHHCRKLPPPSHHVSQ